MANKERDLFCGEYPNFQECSIQTFDDGKDSPDKALARIFSQKELQWQKIDELNDCGAGVFFSVNSMEDGKRNKESVTKINAWICEIDGIEKDEQWKKVKSCPLYPSCIIESKNSLHLYWFAENGTKEKWVDICNGLRNYFDGDPAVVDIARVLRLPGYYHCKNPNDKFMIECMWLTDTRFTEEKMLSKFIDTRSVNQIKADVSKKESNIKKELGNDMFWERVKMMDTKSMIEQISGHQYVNGDVFTFKKNTNGTEQIYVNGQSTASYIHADGDVASKTCGRKRVDWVMWYSACTWKDLYQWIKTNHPHMIEDRNVKVESKIDKTDSVSLNFKHITNAERIERAVKEINDTDPETILKRGRDERDNLLGGIYGGKIYLIGADTGVGKTTFINQVVNNIVATGERVVKYSLEDRMEDLAKEELYYTANRLRRKDGKQFYSWVKFVNNEYRDAEYDKYIKMAKEELSSKNIITLDMRRQIGIDDLILLMEEECKNGTKIFAIDHLHYFEWDTKQSKERLDLQIQSAMQKLNEVSRKYNVAVLMIAHYRQLGNKEKEGRPNYSWFKDGASIKQVANIIIQIDRDIDDELDITSRFHITKLRGPIKVKEFSCTFDINTYEYTFRKSDKQKQKEDKFAHFKS